MVGGKERGRREKGRKVGEMWQPRRYSSLNDKQTRARQMGGVTGDILQAFDTRPPLPPLPCLIHGMCLRCDCFLCPFLRSSPSFLLLFFVLEEIHRGHRLKMVEISMPFLPLRIVYFLLVLVHAQITSLNALFTSL